MNCSEISLLSTLSNVVVTEFSYQPASLFGRVKRGTWWQRPGNLTCLLHSLNSPSYIASYINRIFCVPLNYIVRAYFWIYL